MRKFFVPLLFLSILILPAYADSIQGMILKMKNQQNTIDLNSTTYLWTVLYDANRIPVSWQTLSISSSNSSVVTVGKTWDCTTAEWREKCINHSQDMEWLKGGYVTELTTSKNSWKATLTISSGGKTSVVDLTVGNWEEKVEQEIPAAEPVENLSDTPKTGTHTKGLWYIFLWFIFSSILLFFGLSRKETRITILSDKQ